MPTTTVVINPDSAKARAPASGRDLRAVCAAVLRLGKRVFKLDVGKVIADRFNMSFAQHYDVLPDPNLGAGGASADPVVEQLDVHDAAEWLVTQLNSDERTLLGRVKAGESIVEAGKSSGWGKKVAYKLVERITEKVRRAAAEVGDTDGTVMAEAMAICRGQLGGLRHLDDRYDEHEP